MWAAVPARPAAEAVVQRHERQAPDPASCYPAARCLESAREALAAGEYELAHTLAWRAHQQGSTHEASLLFVLARAQVLSGRAGGAIVTLERLARLGVATGVADDPEFAPVRALPDWPIVEAMFAKQSGPIERTRVALTLPPGVSVSDLAWDNVSRRWLLASAADARILVVGEGERVLSTLVAGATAGFGDSLHRLAIDTERGDLWVVSAANADAGGSRLHRLQLISGRPLATIDGGGHGEIVAVQAVGDGRVVAISRRGTLGRVAAGSRRVVAGKDAKGPTLHAAAFSPSAGGLLAASPDGLFRIDPVTGRVTPVEATGGFSLDGLSGVCAADKAVYVLQAGALGVRRVVQLHFAGRDSAPTAEIVDQNLRDGSTPVACAVADGRLHYVARRGDGSHVIRALAAVR